MKNFVKKEGHAKVPFSFVTEEGYKLGNWIVTQRSYSESLSKERVCKLNDLDFVWDLTEDNWQKAYSSLKKF